MYKNIALTQDEIDVAIGKMINPIFWKKTKLIKILVNTEKIEIKKGVFVLCLAKKKLEKTLIKAKAGKPKAK
tara:strand:+ start:708 stop:923 length:216 start_codon:yes stop_codon:yes gene_type:complete